jgi:Family of unknown function (DUF6529)
MTTIRPGAPIPQPPPSPAAPQSTSSGAAKLIVPCLIGALVALTLGIYGRLHHPTGVVISVAGFSSAGAAKSWLATGAVTLAVVQVISALAMYGKLPRVTAPEWIGPLHKWSGRIAFLLAVPVAVQCLYALGYQTYSTRVLIHSLLGCAFFGAFAIKMLILPKQDVPGWVLPTLGAVVFTVLTGVWLSSAYWFFSTFGIKR